MYFSIWSYNDWSNSVIAHWNQNFSKNPTKISYLHNPYSTMKKHDNAYQCHYINNINSSSMEGRESKTSETRVL